MRTNPSNPPVRARPLLIVDGDNLAHRAYHSTPKSVEGAGGRPINAIVGFFSMLARIYAEEAPRGVFVAWDTLGVDTYRSKLWPAYQGGRVFEQALIAQLNELPAISTAFGFAVGKQAGYEADDLMASAARAECDRGGSCLILTTDRDSYQLVCERVTVLSPQRGTRELNRVGPAEVVGHFGVLPEQVPDFKALCGDPSDCIPGARGIGPKAAAALLLRHGTLEKVLDSWGRADEAGQLLMFREVVRMHDNLPVELPEAGPTWERGCAALKELGAEKLAERLREQLCRRENA